MHTPFTHLSHYPTLTNGPTPWILLYSLGSCSTITFKCPLCTYSIAQPKACLALSLPTSSTIQCPPVLSIRSTRGVKMFIHPRTTIWIPSFYSLGLAINTSIISIFWMSLFILGLVIYSYAFKALVIPCSLLLVDLTNGLNIF
jgi:hypothetical protein